MNILEIVDHFIEQGMTEEQANDLAHSEWQVLKASSEAAVDEAAIEPPVEEAPPVQAPSNGYLPDPSVSIESVNAYGYTGSDKVQ